MKKVVLELDKNLIDGDIMIFKNNKMCSVEIHELLPELKRLDESESRIKVLEQTVANLAKIVKEK